VPDCSGRRAACHQRRSGPRLRRFPDGRGVVAEHKTGNFPPFISSDIGIFTPSAGSPVIISIMTQRHRGQRALVEDTVARMGELIIHAAEGIAG
jgi:hypothetical protein